MSHTPYKRWIAVGLLAAAVATLASPALAGSRRYRGASSASVERVYVRDRSSNVGPVLAGIVGGFILGTAVSNASHTRVVREQAYEPSYDYEPEPAYRYYDPYGDDWYGSLDQCQFRRAGGPQVVFMIDVSSGRCVRELGYRGGRWARLNDGYYSSWRANRGYRYADYSYGRRYRDRDDCDDHGHRHKRHHRHHDDDDD